MSRKMWPLSRGSPISHLPFPCSLVHTSDEASCEVQLADGLAEGAGHHSQPAEEPTQHHHKPAAKSLHQDAAEGPWK